MITPACALTAMATAWGIGLAGARRGKESPKKIRRGRKIAGARHRLPRWKKIMVAPRQLRRPNKTAGTPRRVPQIAAKIRGAAPRGETMAPPLLSGQAPLSRFWLVG